MLNGKEEHIEARERFVWAKADFSKFSDHILRINWYDIFEGMSVNNCYVLFVQEYENAFAKFIPKTTKTITDDKDPWVTPNVTAAIRKKRELWAKFIIAGKFTQTSIAEEHKRASKHVDKTVKKATRDYEEQLVLKAKTNSKIMHSYIWSKHQVRDPIHALKDPAGVTVTSKANICSLLNEYFHSVFVDEPVEALPVFESRTERRLSGHTGRS
jgi:hypothetical protein